MRKLGLFLVLMMFGFQVYAANWDKTQPAGTASPSDIDTLVSANNTALELVLADLRQNAQIVYASASTLTVNAGSLTCSNNAGTLRLMARNTSSTTVSWSDIDTGSEATATTYYVYAVMSSSADTTFTCKISISSTEPTGSTYYRRLGSFYNDASGNITLINNDDDLTEFGDKVSKSADTVYQALTDGFVIAYLSQAGDAASCYAYADYSNPPTTQIINSWLYYPGASGKGYSICFPVLKGQYYKVTSTISNIWFIPKQ